MIILVPPQPQVPPAEDAAALPPAEDAAALPPAYARVSSLPQQGDGVWFHSECARNNMKHATTCKDLNNMQGLEHPHSCRMHPMAHHAEVAAAQVVTTSRGSARLTSTYAFVLHSQALPPAEVAAALPPAEVAAALPPVYARVSVRRIPHRVTYFRIHADARVMYGSILNCACNT